jgi:ABC-type multidrug transport system permease subunit
LLLSFYLIEFQADFWLFYVAVYSLAMASTALAVLLGCSVEDPKMAQEMLPILFVPQMLFAGFFVAPGLIPIYLRWAQYACALTYAVRIMLVAEFDECSQLSPDCLAAVEEVTARFAAGMPECKDDSLLCYTVLDNVKADEDETLWNWAVLIALFVVFRLGALYVLRKKATKFY